MLGIFTHIHEHTCINILRLSDTTEVVDTIMTGYSFGLSTVNNSGPVSYFRINLHVNGHATVLKIDSFLGSVREKNKSG